MLGFLGRKRGVDFNDTTLETFKRIIPFDEYEIRTQDKEIVINGLAKIGYGGLDDQASINKFNSAEFAFFGIDQAEETEKQDVSVLQGSLRLKINGKTPPYKELFTANPAECWLKDDFIIGNRENGVFIPALPDDNPYLPENYKQTLRNAFEYDPALLKAYLEGDWDAFSNLEDALIRPIYINQARDRVSDEQEEDSIRIIAADVATKHGECETVVVYRYGHVIKEIKRFKKIPTTQIAFVIKSEYERHNANVLVVDSDGFGCITPGTEIWTVDGWQKVEDIEAGQKIYSKDENGYLIKSKVKSNTELTNIDIIEKDGYSFSFSHFIPCKTRKEYPYKLKSWDDIYNKDVLLDNEFKWRGSNKDFILKAYKREMPNGGYYDTTPRLEIKRKHFLAFLGWFISEGHLDKNGNRFNEIGITQSRKSKYNKDIRNVLSQCGFKYLETLNKYGAIKYRIFNKVLYKWLKDNCYQKGTIKTAPFKIVPKFVKDSDPISIRYFLNSFRDGDGYIHKQANIYYTSSERLAEDLLELIYKTSSYGVKRKRYKKGSCGEINGRKIIRKHDGYSVYEYIRRSINLRRNKEVKFRKGKVWQLKVDSPTTKFLVRFKDNRAFWVFNEGVSDILTAQNIGVTEFHGGYGQKAVDQKRYRNLRSQFYDITVKKFEKGFYSLKDLEQKDFQDLRRQFCSIKVRPPDALGRRQIETKEDMMARQVSSPDLPDAVVYSEYGFWVAHYEQLRPFAYR